MTDCHELDDIFNVAKSHKIKDFKCLNTRKGLKICSPLRIRMLPGVYPWNSEIGRRVKLCDRHIHPEHSYSTNKKHVTCAHGASGRPCVPVNWYIVGT